MDRLKPLRFFVAIAPRNDKIQRSQKHLSPIEMNTAAPLLGQHTREILTEMLGYTDKEVDQLAAKEVLT